MSQIQFAFNIRWLAFVLIAVFATTAALSTWDESWTADEPVHLVAGLAQIQTGDPRLHVDHTPLARLIAALPALIVRQPLVAERSPKAWQNADYDVVHPVLQEMEERLLRPARLTVLGLSVLLGVLLYRWGCQLFGPPQALLPLALFAFCPPLLANAAIVATDLPVTAFLFAALYGWWRYLASPSVIRALATGLAVGAAFATKHTAVLLLPVFLLTGLAWFVSRLRGGGGLRAIGAVLGGGLAIALATLLIVNLVYWFDGVAITPSDYLVRIGSTNYLGTEGQKSLLEGLARLQQVWPAWLPIPLPYDYVAGALARLSQVSAQGQLTYFLGEAGTGGWPNYFAFMLLIKLSIPALLLIGMGTLAALRCLPQTAWDLGFLLLFPVLLIVTASLGKMQIGIRHLLPVFPFLLLLAGYALPACRRHWERIALLVLVGLNTIGSLAVHPNYLMYYNFLAGGPGNGWRISVNGDDWSQSDRALVRWLQARGIGEVYYDRLAWGNVLLARAGIATRKIPCEDPGQLVAFHIGMLLATRDLTQARCYEWLKHRRPDEKIGYNIFLYNTDSTSRYPRPAPPTELTLFNRALDLQRQGQKAPAIALYRQYLMQEPDYYQAHFNLAYALMESGQCVAAIPEFKRALELWPGYDEVRIHLQRCHQGLEMQPRLPPDAGRVTP
jgi:4-amino-4-deoxy-L-arabinose transferase-like glycosyltransferase